MSYWTEEERDAPARVTLVEIPSRNVLCVKNLFTVADCKMHWQKSGDYLCVKVDRYKKKNEEKDAAVKYGGIYHNFNVFRMRETEIPVDTVEVGVGGWRCGGLVGRTPSLASNWWTCVRVLLWWPGG